MITIRVPATTANLGPGFDCLGLALGIYGYFSFEERESGLEFEGVAEEFQNEENLAVAAYRRALLEMGEPEKGLFLKIRTDIPNCSGLGSSASLYVAGVVAANELHGRPLDQASMLNLVTELEGHPDNVAPALLGGLTSSIVMDDGRVFSMQSRVAPNVHMCAMVPNFSLSTREARAALPRTLSLGDATFNVSRAAVLLKALEAGNFDAISAAMTDRMHEPFRARLIDEYDSVRQMALRSGAAAFCISGAGPTLLAVHRALNFPQRMEQAVKGLRNQWRVIPLEMDMDGATIIEEDEE